MQDVIVMDHLPIRYFDPVVLTVKDKSDRYITITDSGGNNYDLIFDTEEVLMYSNTGPVSILITNNYEMTDYLTKILY